MSNSKPEMSVVKTMRKSEDICIKLGKLRVHYSTSVDSFKRVCITILEKRVPREMNINE